MIKSYGKIECFNDEKGIKHILSETELSGLCGEKFFAVRNYYGRKDYILRRNINAITCMKCKEKFEKGQAVFHSDDT